MVDSQGLHVAGAKVVARNLGTSETREVTADENGEYLFVEMPAGDYEVSAVATGFEEVRAPKVRVDVGVDTVVNLALAKVRGQEQRVEVVESVPLVETASTTLSQVVDRQLVQRTPAQWPRLRQTGSRSLPVSPSKDPALLGRKKASASSILTATATVLNNYNLDGNR